MPEAERRIASAAIARTVAPMLKGDVIALYTPKATEVDTASIATELVARGVRVAYPRVVAGTRVLEFAEGSLASGAFGLLEPSGPALALHEIAAFVIPGIAFSRDGGRIGWGRGYYDATLAAARPDALRIGLAFDCQLVAEIPREAHDIGVDLVVTETASYGRQ